MFLRNIFLGDKKMKRDKGTTLVEVMAALVIALVIAIGVDEEGERHLLGFDLGGSEDEAFWLAFLRSLLKRGLKRVQLVVSDAHEGLTKALSQVFTGASW